MRHYHKFLSTNVRAESALQGVAVDAAYAQRERERRLLSEKLAWPSTERWQHIGRGAASAAAATIAAATAAAFLPIVSICGQQG